MRKTLSRLGNMLRFRGSGSRLRRNSGALHVQGSRKGTRFLRSPESAAPRMKAAAKVFGASVFTLIAMLAFSLSVQNALSYSPQDYPWWNSSFHYRIPANVSANYQNRTSEPVEFSVNFTDVLRGMGISGTFDNNSVRVIEYNASGSATGEIASQFDRGSGCAAPYSASSNAAGEVVWLMNGSTASGANRTYYIYFDITENGAKAAPNYPTGLNHSWDGEELYANSSLMEFRIDTNRSEYTSGIYYAKFKNGVTLFSAGATERTAEYTGFNNGTGDVGFNLYGNMSALYSGPVRSVFVQYGNETNFGSSKPTGAANITKKYYFYENSTWVRIEHNLTSPAGASLTRWAKYPNPLTFDAGRVLSGGAAYSQPSAWSTDPFSAAFAYSGTGSAGVGLLNYMENNTNNYAIRINASAGALVANLSPVSFSSWIGETAVLHFNDTTSPFQFSDFRNRTMAPLNITALAGEYFYVNMIANISKPAFNRNETASITANIISDSFGLKSSVNASLNNGTSGAGDDMEIALYDDGTHGDAVAWDNVYTNTYTFTTYANPTAWNLTAIVYDSRGQRVNTSVVQFNVTNAYSMNLSVLNPTGAGSRIIYANITLKNHLNDTSEPGAQLDCSANGADVANKSDYGNGNYSINFTAPAGIATYTLACNASRHGNNGSATALYYVVATTTGLYASMSPSSMAFGNITYSQGYPLPLSVNVSNYGQGPAYNANITISRPAGWGINSTFVQCGSIMPGGFCSRTFQVDISAGAAAGNYTINATANWTNLDATLGAVANTTNITIAANPVLNISVTNITGSISEGTTGTFNFTVNSTGNENASGINFSSSGLPASWAVAFSPADVTNLSKGGYQLVYASISVPEGYANGTYYGVFYINTSNAENRSIEVNITVPASWTWGLSALSCSRTVLTSSSGKLCDITLSNTGNQMLDFAITPADYGNYTQVNETSFSASPASAHMFAINYTSEDAQGTFARTYSVGSSNGTTINITTSLTVTYGPSVSVSSIYPNLTEQLSSVAINATVVDLTQSGIASAWLNVTRPSGANDTQNLTFISNATWTRYYSANYNGTWGNLSDRGLYTFVLFATDNAGATKTANGNFTLYKAMFVNLSSDASTYSRNDNGRIFYNVSDTGNSSLAGVNVSFEIRSPSGAGIFNPSQSWLSNGNGTLDLAPLFQLGQETGVYVIYANSHYNDTVANVTVNKTSAHTFGVTSGAAATGIKVLVDTVEWYTSDTARFWISVYNGQPLADASTVNVSLYDPAGNLVSNSFTINHFSTGIYYADWAVPSGASIGQYMVRAGALVEGVVVDDIAAFSVNPSGPFRFEIDAPASAYIGQDMRFTVTATNEGSGEAETLFNCWVAVGGEKRSTMTWQKLISSSQQYVETKTITVPSGITAGAYPLQCTLHIVGSTSPDSYAQDSFNALAAPAAPPTALPAAGGAVYAAPPANITALISLKIVAVYPSSLKIGKGESAYIIVIVNNTGTSALHNIRAGMTGVNPGWYSAVSGISALERGAVSFALLKMSVPLEANEGASTLAVSAASGEGASDYADLPMEIFSSLAELLRAEIEQLRSDIGSMKLRAAEAEKAGMNLTVVRKMLDAAEGKLALADVSMEAANYSQAKASIGNARDTFNQAVYEFLDMIKAAPAPQISMQDVKDMMPWFVALAVIAAACIIAARFSGNVKSAGAGIGRARGKMLPKRESREAKRVEEALAEEFGKPEISQAELEVKRKEVEDMLKILKEEYEEGLLSEDSYQEMRRKNEGMLVSIEKQIMSVIMPGAAEGAAAKEEAAKKEAPAPKPAPREKPKAASAKPAGAKPAPAKPGVARRARRKPRRRRRGRKAARARRRAHRAPRRAPDSGAARLLAQARRMVRSGVMTKEEFRKIKKRYEARASRRRKESNREFRARLDRLQRDMAAIRKMMR